MRCLFGHCPVKSANYIENEGDYIAFVVVCQNAYFTGFD